MKIILSIYSYNSYITHRRLETEARATKMKPVQAITEYFNKYRNIRRRIYQVSYPRITDGTNSVLFVVNGLDGHPKYRDAGRAISLTGLPSSLRILEDRLMEEEAQMTDDAQGFYQYSDTQTPYNPRCRLIARGCSRGGESIRQKITRDLTDTIKKEIAANIPTPRK